MLGLRRRRRARCWSGRNVYPNGIAFDAQGRLYWTESIAHRVCRLDDGQATTFCQLSDGHVPDGMAFAADGRLFVCTTISGGLTVLSPEGEVLEEISLGEHATNCIFDGSTLYVTATKVAEIHADQRTGTFWRVETDASGPLPLLPGQAVGAEPPGPGPVRGQAPCGWPTANHPSLKHWCLMPMFHAAPPGPGPGADSEASTSQVRHKLRARTDAGSDPGSRSQPASTAIRSPVAIACSAASATRSVPSASSGEHGTAR